MQIVEQALGREHLGSSDRQFNANNSAITKEKHLWHANMPNIRIAFMISQFRYDLRNAFGMDNAA